LIKSKKISKFKIIKHGFFNQRGGVSKGIYESLNCGLGSRDKKKDVINNLKIVCKKIGAKYEKLVLLNQVHSNKFFFIKKNHNFNKNIEADSVITNVKNVAIGILTADCVPVLIYDHDKKIISAIHAGWKGAYKGVISKTINFLIKNGSDLKNLIAVIGPCISDKSYEIKKKFMDKFIKKDPINRKFFKIKKNETYFCLNKYVYSQLRNLGIKNLEVINKDTFERKNNFFSARRALKNKENDYGRNISIIMIN
jgi:YfiH family protein